MLIVLFGLVFPVAYLALAWAKTGQALVATLWGLGLYVGQFLANLLGG